MIKNLWKSLQKGLRNGEKMKKRRSGSKPLPATMWSEIVPITKPQKKKLKELEAKGWIAQTEPDAIFNGALIIEGTDGNNYFIYPDGSLSTPQCE